jgi:Lar family restriction alleviation protein
MENDLKPCPFCGGEAELFMDNYIKYGAYCLKCGLYIGIELECGTELIDGWKAVCESKETIIQRWNRRTPDIDIPPDRLQEICKAEAEGRVIVLPCKVGTPVFIINCDSVDCNYCERDGGHGNCPFITKPICPLGIIQRVSYGYNHINKPIFFDFNAAVVYKEKYCEQAEAALKGETP